MINIKIMKDLKVLYLCKFQIKKLNKMKKTLKSIQVKIYFSSNPVTFIRSIHNLKKY